MTESGIESADSTCESFERRGSGALSVEDMSIGGCFLSWIWRERSREVVFYELGPSWRLFLEVVVVGLAKPGPKLNHETPAKTQLQNNSQHQPSSTTHQLASHHGVDDPI